MESLSSFSYLLPPMIGLLITIILTVVVWHWAQASTSRRIFLGLLFSVGLWCLLTFGMRSSTNLQQALLWDKTLPLITCTTFVLYYHFTITYTKGSRQRGILLASYLLLVVIAAFTPTDLIIKGMRLATYGYAPVIGPLTYPLILLNPFWTVGALYNLIKRYRISSSYEEKNLLVYLSIAAMFPLVGLLLDALTDLPPASIWGNLLFCTLCSVAILRYRLLDIRVVVRKGLVYLLISIVAAMPYAALFYLLTYYFKPIVQEWWMHAILILLLAFLLRPFYGWAQQLIDRLFYRDRYDYFRALEQFSRETQSITNLKELGDSMVQLVLGALRASGICLLLASEKKQGFVLVSSIGLEGPLPEIVLRNSSPLVKWLKRHDDIVSSEQLDVIPQLQSFSIKERNNLELIGAELCVPMKTRQGQLSGILILGSKRSQQAYSREEKQLLMTLSSQMAMALENARLYDSEKTLRVELEKIDKQKTEFLHGVAHELKTPLTAILSSSEILGEEKRLDVGLRKKLVNNIHHSALSMDRRVTELLDLARMHIGELIVKPQELDIAPVLNEIVSQLLVLFEDKRQNLLMEIPSSLSKVRADRFKLEQVFYNLLSNANKFSPVSGNVVVRLKEADSNIVVEVEDSAIPLTEEEKEKVFTPYYRGEDVDERERISGLGLGLSISKKIVELHEGRLWLETKPSKGNIFAFSLPVFKQKH
jgi:signal transduction histidine kinase